MKSISGRARRSNSGSLRSSAGSGGTSSSPSNEQTGGEGSSSSDRGGGGGGGGGGSKRRVVSEQRIRQSATVATAQTSSSSSTLRSIGSRTASGSQRSITSSRTAASRKQTPRGGQTNHKAAAAKAGALHDIITSSSTSSWSSRSRHSAASSSTSTRSRPRPPNTKPTAQPNNPHPHRQQNKPPLTPPQKPQPRTGRDRAARAASLVGHPGGGSASPTSSRLAGIAPPPPLSRATSAPDHRAASSAQTTAASAYAERDIRSAAADIAAAAAAASSAAAPDNDARDSDPWVYPPDNNNNSGTSGSSRTRRSSSSAAGGMSVSMTSRLSELSQCSDITEHTDNRAVAVTQRVFGTAAGGGAAAVASRSSRSTPPRSAGSGTAGGMNRDMIATMTSSFTSRATSIASASLATSSSDASYYSLGSSVVSGDSEMTEKRDNTFGQTIARRAIAEVERELDDEDSLEESIEEEEEKELGASQIFDTSYDAAPEVAEDSSTPNNSSSLRSSSSASGSFRSRQELQKRLQELRLAKQELKCKEKELKVEVKIQKEVEQQQKQEAEIGLGSSSAEGHNGAGDEAPHESDNTVDVDGISGNDADGDAQKVAEICAQGRKLMLEKNYTAAKRSFDRVLNLYRSLSPGDVDASARANVHHDIGTAELELGEYDKALVNLRTAKRMHEATKDRIGVAKALKECARLYAKMGKVDDASRCFSECLEIMTTEIENPQVVEICVDFGFAAKELGKEREAIEHYEEALDLIKLHASMIPDDKHVHQTTCSLLNVLGNLEFDIGDLERALEHLQEFVSLRKKSETSLSVHDAGVQLTISKIHRKMGNFDQAHEASKEALATSREQRREVALHSRSSVQSLGSSQDSSGLSGLLQLSAAPSKSEAESSSNSEQEPGYIPFVQVFEDDHKKQIRRDSLRAVMMKVYYTCRKARDEAAEVLYDVSEVMAFLAQDAKQILSDPYATEEQQDEVMENLLFDGIDLSVSMIDTHAPMVYGIEMSDRLFWEAYVMPHDIEMYRNAESTGAASSPIAGFRKMKRGSNPEIQVKNLNALQSSVNSHPLAAVPVVLQMDTESPMSPQTLIVAWEKEGRVQPANGLASDFHERYS